MNWIRESLTYLKYEYSFGDENDYNDYVIIGKDKPAIELLKDAYDIYYKEQQIKVRQSSVQKLLLESDYIELPSFLERKGQETYSLWMSYRENLRLAYHNIEIPIPEKPTNEI